MSKATGLVGTGTMRLPMAHNLLAPQTAADAHMPMPLASLLHARLMAGVAKGREEMDWSALTLRISEDAGIAAKQKGSHLAERTGTRTTEFTKGR